MSKCDIGRKFTQLQLHKLKRKYKLSTISDTCFFTVEKVLGKSKDHKWIKIKVNDMYGFACTPLNELFELIYTVFITKMEYSIEQLEQIYVEYELAVLPIPTIDFAEFQLQVHKCLACQNEIKYCTYHALIYDYLDFAAEL